MNNFINNRKGIVLSQAIKGQGGYGHLMNKTMII